MGWEEFNKTNLLGNSTISSIQTKKQKAGQEKKGENGESSKKKFHFSVHPDVPRDKEAELPGKKRARQIEGREKRKTEDGGKRSERLMDWQG